MALFWYNCKNNFDPSKKISFSKKFVTSCIESGCFYTNSNIDLINIDNLNSAIKQMNMNVQLQQG